jgi:hypothetical protein
MLRATLGAVDRFFGDKDRAVWTLFPGAFGLRERAPLWTAHSYDRCLLVAQIYPIAVVALIWAASGQVGPAQEGLQLPQATAGWGRTLIMAWLALAVACGLLFRWTSSWLRLLTVAIFCGSVVGFMVVLPAASVFLIAFIVARAVARTTGKIAYGALSLVLALAAALLIAIPNWFAVAGVMACGGVLVIVAVWAESSRFFGRLLLLWTLAALLIVIVLSGLIGGFPRWDIAGPILLFLVLLTLVNGPFDWITLGLTRALLRRGLELGGWWPLAFGLIDLFVAAAVMAALSVTVLLSVQMFGHFAMLGGGRPVLDVSQVLGALADPQRRSAPEFWWLYVMLFSTLIPSVVNVAVGALSILRGFPGLHAWLARRMPVGKAIPNSERMWMAPALTLQMMLSAMLGIGAVLGLLWMILIWELPFIGQNLISMLQGLAEADLPGRLLRATGIG